MIKTRLCCWWWWWWWWWWPCIGSSNSKARKSKLGEKADNWRRIWSRYDQMRSDTYDQTNEMRSIVMKWGFQFGLASILFWIQDLGLGGLDKWMFLREASARNFGWFFLFFSKRRGLVIVDPKISPRRLFGVFFEKKMPDNFQNKKIILFFLLEPPQGH